MKVMVGHFSTESNANIGKINNISDYRILFGQQCLDNLGFTDVFYQNDIEVIPSCFASGGPSGICSLETYKYIESCFISTLKNHLDEIDGICLFCHGATEVEEIGSGEHNLIKAIREVTGPYLPIAISCDPHGNLEKEYVQSLQIIRSFRESPHTDILDTKRLVAQMLCDLLKDRQNIYACYRKLPLILGGEQSVSADEPVKSINIFMDEMEKDERIRSASWHVGYIRHDTKVAGCGVVVIPQTEADQEYADKKCQELADYVWERRRVFHYTGLTAKPDETLKMAIEFEDKPVFITDSGDNVTSGANGTNTWLLKKVIELNPKKRFLFSCIRDDKLFNQLIELEKDTVIDVELGNGLDDNNPILKLKIKLLEKGIIFGNWMNDPNRVEGESILINVVGYNIDIVIINRRHSSLQLHHFKGYKADEDNYDVIVVKQGYIFPELKEKGKLNIMALTDGPTLQDTASLKFKKILRPMYPIDNI